MEGGRIKAKAFKAKAFKAKALAIEVWPAKRLTIYMATYSRKKTLRTPQTMENGTIVQPTLSDILLNEI
jgi:hypothetical protein